MEKKKLSAKTTRILYTVIIAVLCVTAIVLGIVSVAKRSSPATPDAGGSLPTEDTPPNGDTQTDPQPSGKEDGTPTQVVYLCPLTGTLARSHDEDTLIQSSTMGDWRTHTGMDIAAALGADVCASAAGTIQEVWEDDMMGMSISIDHGNGVVTCYQNLGSTLPEGIAAGKEVKSGDVIAQIGESSLRELGDAPHLHFSVTVDGVEVDPFSYLSPESCAASLTQNDTVYED